MNNFTKLALSIALVCILTGCPRRAKKARSSEAPAKAKVDDSKNETLEEYVSVFKDSKVGADFPDYLAGLTYETNHRYPEKGLGYSVRYVNRSLTMSMDIFVYDKGLTDIPDGFDNPLVARQMAEESALKQFYEQKGIYRDVVEVDSGYYPRKTHFDSPSFQWSRLRLNRANGPGVVLDGEQFTETFIRGHNQHLIKVRITYPTENEDVCEKIRVKAIERIVKMLKI